MYLHTLLNITSFGSVREQNKKGIFIKKISCSVKNKFFEENPIFGTNKSKKFK